jgi:small-conductance mechanosensitive channel/CRP-like cAMP-binding protein
VGGWSSSWVVLEWSAITLVGALVLPFVLPSGHRQHGGTARLVLALAVGLALAAAGASTNAMDAPARMLHLGAVLALLCGLVGLAGLVLFDLVLPALRVDVPSILRDVVQVAIASLVVLVCLRLAGIDVLPLLTTSAVLTAVIGLALQSTIANLFGGLSLQLDRTLGQGDWIETGSHSGRIVEIGWRSTRLVTHDGDTLFLPNSQLVTGEVRNLSRPTGAHRVSLRVSVHHRHAPGHVRQILLDAVRDVPGVLVYPPPDCLIADLTDVAVVYAVRYWLTEFDREAGIAGEVRSRLWYATRRAGLEPAAPAFIVARVPEADVATVRASRPDDHAERMALLRGVELFGSLTDETRARLADGMRRLEFTAGEPIVQQGASDDALYVVQRGEIGIHVEVEGSSSEVAALGPGEVFGEMSLITGEPRSATCTARTEVACYVIDRVTLQGVLDEQPEIAEHLSTTLAARQTRLDAERDGLSAVSRTRLESERRSRMRDRIRDLFGMD